MTTTLPLLPDARDSWPDLHRRSNPLTREVEAILVESGILPRFTPDARSNRRAAFHFVTASLCDWMARRVRGVGGTGIVHSCAHLDTVAAVELRRLYGRDKWVGHDAIEQQVEWFRGQGLLHISEACRAEHRARVIAPTERMYGLVSAAAQRLDEGVRLGRAISGRFADLCDDLPPSEWGEICVTETDEYDSRRRRTLRGPETAEMSAELAAFNRMNTSHDWAFPTIVTASHVAPHQPVAIDCADLGAYDVAVGVTRISPGSLVYRRCFSYGRTDAGGRFYNRISSTMLSEHRLFMTVNGESMRSADFKSLHPRLAYASVGLVAPTDCYAVPGRVPDLPRDLLKAIAVVTLAGGGVDGVQEQLAAVRLKRTRMYWLARSYGAAPPNMDIVTRDYSPTEIRAAIRAFRRAHKPIAHLLKRQKKGTANRAVQWQYTESCIARTVMRRFTELGRPLLVVHDGFQVAERDYDELKRTMLRAFREVTGVDIAEDRVDGTKAPFSLDRGSRAIVGFEACE